MELGKKDAGGSPPPFFFFISFPFFFLHFVFIFLHLQFFAFSSIVHPPPPSDETWVLGRCWGGTGWVPLIRATNKITKSLLGVGGGQLPLKGLQGSTTPVPRLSLLSLLHGGYPAMAPQDCYSPPQGWLLSP